MNKKWKWEKRRKNENEKNKWTENEIGVEGANKISESLKVNTTLTKLNLHCDELEYKWKREGNENERTNWQGTKLEQKEQTR